MVARDEAEPRCSVIDWNYPAEQEEKKKKRKNKGKTKKIESTGTTETGLLDAFVVPRDDKTSCPLIDWDYGSNDAKEATTEKRRKTGSKKKKLTSETSVVELLRSVRTEPCVVCGVEVNAASLARHVESHLVQEEEERKKGDEPPKRSSIQQFFK